MTPLRAALVVLLVACGSCSGPPTETANDAAVDAAADAGDECSCLMLTYGEPPAPVQIDIPSFRSQPASSVMGSTPRRVRDCGEAFCMLVPTTSGSTGELVVVHPSDPSASVTIPLPQGVSETPDFATYGGKAYVLANYLGASEPNNITNSVYVYDLSAPAQPPTLIKLPDYTGGDTKGQPPANTNGISIAIAAGRAYVVYDLSNSIFHFGYYSLAIIDTTTGSLVQDLVLPSLLNVPLSASTDAVYAGVPGTGESAGKTCLQKITGGPGAVLGCTACPPVDRYFGAMASAGDGSMFVAVVDWNGLGPVQKLRDDCTLEDEPYLLSAGRAQDINVCGKYMISSSAFFYQPSDFVVADIETRMPLSVPSIALLNGLPHGEGSIACVTR